MKHPGTTLAIVILLGINMVMASRAAQTMPADAEAYKQMMNDAADAQEDLREALAAKEMKSVSTAARKLEGFMAQSESYWVAKRMGEKMADVVKLAATARTQARDLVTAAAANKADDVSASFGKLSATCNSCHELHAEKR